MIQPPTLNVFNIEQSAMPTNHVHPFTEPLLETFVVPNIGSQTTVRVRQALQYQVGMWIWISGGGYFRVTGIPDQTHIYIINDGVSASSTPGTAVPIGSVMMPATQPDLSSSAATAASLSLYDITTDIFVAPSGALATTVYMQNLASWVTTGMVIYIEGAGYYTVTSVNSISQSATVVNSSIRNLAAGTSLSSGAHVWPAALPGERVKSGIVLACDPTLSTADETIGTVVFTNAFASVPHVVLSYTPASALGAILVVYPTSVTAAGFTIKQSCGAINDVNIDVSWVASIEGNV